VPHLVGKDDSDYNYFLIPGVVKYAAQALAMNEYRGGLANFNARSIKISPDDPNSATRVEEGFVGSHADIGGGYGTGDLSDVALMWMLDQAASQKIQFNMNVVHFNGWDVVTDPIVHDKSGNKKAPSSAPAYDDRTVSYLDGSSVKESKLVIDGKDGSWAKSNIKYYDTWCGPKTAPAVGVVDMDKYSTWLKTLGVDIGYTPLKDAHPCS
jgi:hypothetical protein